MPDPGSSLTAPTIQKVFNRETFPGRADLESTMHPLLVEGAREERSLGDALYNSQEGVNDLKQKINHYTDLRTLASHTAISDEGGRAGVVQGDVAKAASKIQEYVGDLQTIAGGLEGIVGYAQLQKTRVQGFIQENLNTISTFIHEICNFGLPDLPSIPNLFGSLYFDGFAFPKGAFNFQVSFDTKFAFSTCVLRKPNLDIFRNFPKGPFVLGKSGIFSNPQTQPPFSGAVFADPGRLQTDPAYVVSIRNQTNPAVFDPFFIPQDSFQGALPKPSTILSNYSIPQALFQTQVLSLFGDPSTIIADMNPSGTMSSTGANTTTTATPGVTQDQARAALQGAVRLFCIGEVNLGALVTSNWDPYRTMAWVFYLQATRAARGGQWIPAFEHVYETYILPTYTAISTADVPWHSDPADQTKIVQGPQTTLPLIAAIKAMPPNEQFQLYWMLSYIEASLLGYTRNTEWDLYGSSPFQTPLDVLTASFVTGPTGADLDYLPLAATANSKVLDQLLDSQGAADFPSTFSYPDYASVAINYALQVSGAAIANAKGHFTAPLPSQKYVYTPSADTITINGYSQFWRVFKANWTALNQQDPALLAVVLRYPQVLASALNPLGDGGALYQTVKTDHASRVAAWIPGTPFPATPYIPLMVIPPMQLAPGIPTGWDTGTFDPIAYLARPDIASLPINVQSSMVFYNQSASALQAQSTKVGALYDGIISSAQAQIDDITAQIAAAEAYLAANP